MGPRTLLLIVPIAMLPGSIAACADDTTHDDPAPVAASTPAPSAVHAAGGYRFVREPVVYLTIDPKEPNDVTYDVSFRLNRPLPRESIHIKATLTIGGASPSGEILRYGRRARACYAATINFKAPEIPKPRFGLIVNARLKIDGVKPALVARVRLRNYAIDQASDFHCGKGGFDRQE